MTALVIRMTIISDATTWSIIYDCHSVNSNIFMIHATRMSNSSTLIIDLEKNESVVEKNSRFGENQVKRDLNF